MQLDIAGAARDLDQLVQHHHRVLSAPRFPEACTLLVRNPGLAPLVEAFILAQEGVVTEERHKSKPAA